jgi:hypothetical protein
MSRFDLTKTNIAVERLIETTENPRHLYLLHAYNRHRYLEMAGRFEEIFAPDMTVAEPVYHFNMYGETLTLEGAEAVKSVYAEWTAAGQNVFYTDGETLAISDDLIVSKSTMYQQTSGKVLVASGVDVDPDAWFLMKSAEYMIWPYADGLLVGEDVWEYDATQREVIPLDPSEVLTVEQCGRLLAPLIKPLPSVNPFTA